jgi:arylsulfatase A-like enzyme
MNVILIVFDTLRKDCVGAYGSPPWGKVHTPHLDAFTEQSAIMTKAYPNVLPTLPARIALYTGQQVYPFEKGDIHLKGDFVGAPGWGPIPERWPTISETLQETGYRTALISDLHHMFKPSKNFWRGFDQWTFLRGQEADNARSGPRLSQNQMRHWLPDEIMESANFIGPVENFVQQCIMNMNGRSNEEDYFVSRVFLEASRWLEQNQDAEKFFLTIESFAPHEPWLVPEHYRKMYDAPEDIEQVISVYGDVSAWDQKYLDRTIANYSGLVTMCDRWFGYFMESLRVLGVLEDTLVIVTSDHGHSLGEGDYLGKRGYPSGPEVYDVPLLIRFPDGDLAGSESDMVVQHADLTASILEELQVPLQMPLDGKPFFSGARNGRDGDRNHVTVGWGSTPTVITDRWWFNCKADGKGVLLYDLNQPNPFRQSVADENRDVVDQLFGASVKDAGGAFPTWLVELAESEADAPGCSILAARAG